METKYFALVMPVSTNGPYRIELEGMHAVGVQNSAGSFEFRSKPGAPSGPHGPSSVEIHSMEPILVEPHATNVMQIRGRREPGYWPEISPPRNVAAAEARAALRTLYRQIQSLQKSAQSTRTAALRQKFVQDAAELVAQIEQALV